mgnify:FL=1
MSNLIPTRGSPLTGLLLAMTGAVGFASKGIFAKALYAGGWSVDSVLLLRALCAVPCMVVWTIVTEGSRVLRIPNVRAIGWTAFAGIACYYFGATWDFEALKLIDASVERVLLFSYPSIVVIIDALLYKRLPHGSTLGALLITYTGILMVVTGLDLHILRGNLAGAGLVLACAVTSAAYYVTGDRWARSIGSAAFSVYALAAATLCLTARHVYNGQQWQISVTWQTTALFIGLVICATVVPMLAMAEGVRRLGAPRASIVSTVGPPTTILLGAWLLDEHLSLIQWLGVALIVGGILFLEALRRRRAPAG